MTNAMNQLSPQVIVRSVPDVVTFVTEAGEQLLHAPLLTVNTIITLAQQGLDPKSIDFVEIYTARVQANLNDRFSVNLTAMQAYQVAQAAGRIMGGALENFTPGPK